MPHPHPGYIPPLPALTLSCTLFGCLYTEQTEGLECPLRGTTHEEPAGNFSNVYTEVMEIVLSYANMGVLVVR